MMNQLLALVVCFISIKLTVCDIDRAWMSFKETYHKTYFNKRNEEMRKQIFIKNTLMIQLHNARFYRGEVTFNMGMNKFGDLTHEEFLKSFMMREVDWNDRGSRRSIQISLNNTSINDEILTSDATIKNRCLLNRMKNGTVPLSIKKCLNHSSEQIDISKNLCKNGPMIASISAERPNFQFAKEGIYSEDECDTTPNHKVLLVGYYLGENSEAHWIVKNSFGSSWGVNGFLKIAAERSKKGCRIVKRVSYPEF